MGICATAFWGLVIVACVGFAVVVIAAWGWVDWPRLFNTSSPAVTHEAVGCDGFLAIGIFSNDTASIHKSAVCSPYQEGASANAVQLPAQLGGALGINSLLPGLVAVCRCYRLLWHSSQWIVSFTATLWLFKSQSTLYLTAKTELGQARDVLGLGGLFLLVNFDAAGLSKKILFSSHIFDRPGGGINIQRGISLCKCSRITCLAVFKSSFGSSYVAILNG